MSRRKPLSCQSTKLFIVIRKNKSIPLDKIKEYCILYFSEYAFIEHINHIDPSNGFVIPVHYHIVGNAITSKVPFSTRLNQICDFFKFDNANGIEIDQYVTLEGAIQYLTHKNNPEKTQVDKSMIIHNFDEADFNILYNADVGNIISFDLLFTACLECNNIIDVIKRIGVSNYRTYRNVVWDIWKTLNEDKQYIKQ